MSESCAAVVRFSRYLSRQLEIHPDLRAECDERAPWPMTLQMLADAVAIEATDEAQLKTTLRRVKRRALTRIAAYDLGRSADLSEVVSSISALAQWSIASALTTLDSALRQTYGVPRNEDGLAQELIVIGMGKLGGGELNVSSDIDLIFVYPDDGQTDAAPTGARSISNFEYFTRLGRKLINAISDVTEEGIVFRVDMRLRPNGDSGPLVCSFDMLEEYFQTQGREWERYAWIKARPLTGVRHPELEAIRRAFVFRKYLDFGAIDALRGLHAQIRREVAKKDMASNIKLGPGGIREIEFIAQVFQLIRGGREPGLQIRPTCDALGRLADQGQLPQAAQQGLCRAYDFLRRLEHRLQYLDDAQTQCLPTAPGDQALVAQAMGFEDYPGLLCALDVHRSVVSQHFEAVFAAPKQSISAVLPPAGDDIVPPLERLGYGDPAALAARVRAIREGARFAQLSEVARGRFDALLPLAMTAAAQTASPDSALLRALDLFEAVARRSAYLSLLYEYPQALDRLVRIMGASRWAAEFLQRHPVLLDELLDSRLLDSSPSLSEWHQFRADLSSRLDTMEPDTEQQMDSMREAYNGQVFRLLAQDVSGVLPLERLSDHLSALADQLLAESLDRVWRKLPQRHRELPRFALISYGKLGGKELGYASDLDLIFVFDDDHPEAAFIYSRLATRLNNWLSARTAAGQLFDTDLRLRPNGESGLVVTSFDAFCQYQIESAWLWEHQALTRARFSAGDASLGQRFEDFRIQVLQRPRDWVSIQQDVVAMRKKMADAHAGKRPGLFDLKHDPGGLIDVEFIVQALILGYAQRFSQLCANLGNIALLGLAAEQGLIPVDLASATRTAYRAYRSWQHAARLDSQPAAIDPDQAAPHAHCVMTLWQHLFGTPYRP
jgi:glutamate-ammonia-ligase adenylyltransferase